MYGAEYQDYVEQLGQLAELSEPSYRLLDASLSCYLHTAAEQLGALAFPRADFLDTSVRIALLSDALSRRMDGETDGVHYLLALALEQSAFLLSSQSNVDHDLSRPLDHPEWMRLVLAVLHYLAGGYRVQAVAAMARLRQIAAQVPQERRPPFFAANRYLGALFDGSLVQQSEVARWRRIFFEDVDLPDPVEALLNRLSRQVRAHQGVFLAQIGGDDPAGWLASRGIQSDHAFAFWKNYMLSLQSRGVVSFTREQVGPGFDSWLQLDKDLLVVLPTGSGKSLVGELRTALTIAAGASCVWVQPTRALVRQSHRELRRAFRRTGVVVQELPTTEDAAALFAESVADTEPVVATTTPERLNALIRANPGALSAVRLVIMDEAQLLRAEGRGMTAEHLLSRIRRHSPECRLVLMTAFEDAAPLLDSVLVGLGTSPIRLAANTRPTRRIYGVLRATQREDAASIQAIVYPPRPSEGQAGEAAPTFAVVLPDKTHSTHRSGLDTARRFLQASSRAALRSVLFVSRKDSTEVQALRLIGRGGRVIPLPEPLRRRLQLELGRPSCLEDVAPHGVAPHHAGLLPLEQHLVERLVAHRRVRTVIATPTLAQGVNLPLDVSIVTFTSRYDAQSETSKELSETEVQNMLGRAGRAGYVPDGLCLIARDENKLKPRDLLGRERKWFFSRAAQTRAPGVVELLRRAASAGVGIPGWHDEMLGLRFSESQALLSLVARIVTDATDVQVELSEYPSFRALTQAEQTQLVSPIQSLVGTLGPILADDVPLRDAIARTGLPLGFVASVLDSLRVSSTSDSNTADWWDTTIGQFFQANASLPWMDELCSPFAPKDVVDVLRAWRSGVPVSEIEEPWSVSDKPRKNRIEIGDYLNHSASLVAQFWGLAPVLAGTDDVDLEDGGGVRQLAACIREGVPSVEALIWLRALGGLDRVLATRLGALELLQWNSYSIRRREAARLLDEWEKGESSPLSPLEQAALEGVLHEETLLSAVTDAGPGPAADT